MFRSTNAFEQVGSEKLAAGAMHKLRPEQKRTKLSRLLRGSEYVGQKRQKSRKING